MNLLENIRQALRAIRSNMLRTVLTILIIAVGIMSLVGMMTAMESMKSTVNSSFNDLGANNFKILDANSGVQSDREKVNREMPNIEFEQAIMFKEKYKYPAIVSVSTRASMQSTIKYESKETNPNVMVFGVDENYISVSGYNLLEGRNFSMTEIESGSNVVLLGSDVVAKIAGENISMADREISIGSLKYSVLGVLKSKGASWMSSDNLVLIPLRNARNNFNTARESHMIVVTLEANEEMDKAIGEATGLFRSVRKLRPSENDDFEISTSDQMAGEMNSIFSVMTIAASLIGGITLLGAVVGLLNIMLVAVHERTREIGVSKALGANNSMIMKQFLIEAITICQIGGLFGIVLGILIGNGIAALINTEFIIPWGWMIFAAIICLVVGLAAGIYPAIKASRLDPIESLRYE